METEKIDRSRGMQIICEELEKRNIELSKLDALDVFARKGDWQTFVYAKKVKSLEVWEVDKSFENDLKKNVPFAKIKITDSIKEIKSNVRSNKYGFVMIDNPQGNFGIDEEYCEHFDILPQLSTIIDKEAILIFNINKEPFNYDRFPKWKKRREMFYNSQETGALSIDFIKKFYENYFIKYDLVTEFCFEVFRKECEPYSYLYYLVFKVKRK